MRESWTDERLDDFSRHVDQRFDRVEGGLSALRQEMNDRFERVDSRLDSMQRSMIQLASVIIAALVGVVATQLGLILTQL